MGPVTVRRRFTDVWVEGLTSMDSETETASANVNQMHSHSKADSR